MTRSHVPQGLEPYSWDLTGTPASIPPPSDDVGSSAIEAALADLERALCRDRCHAVVSAPLGPGKVLLLRALAERLAGSFCVVRVQPCRIRDDEICARILSALGEDPEPDAEMRLLSVLQKIGARGSALALLIDDAGSLPAATLRRLGRLAAIARPDLRLALVVTSGDRSGGGEIPRVVAALGVGAEKVVLDSPMNRAEPTGISRPVFEAAPPPTEPVEARARDEKVLDAIRVARRRSGPQSAQRRRAGTVALGIALALLGVHKLSLPAPGGLAPEVQNALELDQPIRAAVAAAQAALWNAVAPSAALAPETVPQPPPAPAPAAIEEVSAAGLARGADAGPPPAAEAAEVEQPALSGAGAEAVGEAPPVEPTPAASDPPPARIPVSVNAQPWARIEVDGQDVGVTPLGNLRLAPGPHRFRAHLPDGRVVERTAPVDAYRDHVVFP